MTGVQNGIKRLFYSLLQPFFAIFLGLLTGAIAISIVGEPVLASYKEMWNGAFGNFYFLTSTLARATPIMLVGLGVALAFRAGVFNLGAEGQMVLGAVSAALAGVYIPGTGIGKTLLVLLVGILAGGLWSLLAGWLEAKFKVQLLISTLLLNYVAVLFASYLVSDPFQDKTGSGALAQTHMLDQSIWLPKLFQGMSVHWGFLIAVGAAIIMFIIFRTTSAGYEVKMLGLNPFFASYGGVNKIKVMLTSMFISGALSGLAGTVEVLGSQYRFVDGALTVPGYAWTGLMATLLANSHPIGTAITSIFLAAIETGAMGMERNTQVPLEVSSIIQSVLILFISAKLTLKWWKRKSKVGGSHGTL
ncbi:ABC transporter permease [Metabacillus litoralis]|uniref:ABC transporter permease n=1 Tax=Metabacillus litoralis TaxID=152268 RepID=A0A5C6VVP9_9BACI|nr:ABC transporter permease [Metabacillus litoralis]TXC89493.1 ABC transporter permease [Metabacillus litoralis]